MSTCISITWPWPFSDHAAEHRRKTMQQLCDMMLWRLMNVIQRALLQISTSHHLRCRIISGTILKSIHTSSITCTTRKRTRRSRSNLRSSFLSSGTVQAAVVREPQSEVGHACRSRAMSIGSGAAAGLCALCTAMLVCALRARPTAASVSVRLRPSVSVRLRPSPSVRLRPSPSVSVR